MGDGSVSVKYEAYSDTLKNGMTPPGRMLTVPVLFLLFYIVVEYGRPVFLEVVHPAMIINIVLTLFLVMNGHRLRALFKDQYIKLFVFMMLQMAVLVLLAVNNYWAYMQFQQMLFYLIIAISICLFVDNIEKVKMLLTAFVLIMTVPAIYQTIYGYRPYSSTGFMGDTNDFALAMNVAIPLSYFLGLSCAGFKRVWFWVLAVIQILASGSAASRGGFVGLVAVTALIWFHSKKKVALSLVLLTIGIAFYLYIPNDFRGEILTLDSAAESDTGEGRIELWKVAWKIFLSSPAIGVGQGNIQILMAEFQYDEQGYSYWGDQTLWAHAVHSIYFTILPELGALGTLIWAMMIYHSFHKCTEIAKNYQTGAGPPGGMGNRNPTANIAKGLAIGLAGYLVSGIFLSAFYYPYFWNLCSFITALHLMTRSVIPGAQRQLAPTEGGIP